MVCINGLQNMMMETNMEDNKEENLNPTLPDTRFGVLRVPETNIEKEKRLVPILKFDDWGNETNE